MTAPLEGIRVVEFSLGIQGPLAGTYLAEMGAEVIKVEPPTGDGTRWNLGPSDFPEDASGSPQFLVSNRGKRFLQLDAHAERAREVIKRLVESADVFVTNYREAAMGRLNLDYDSLSEINPRLIYGSVSGFGPKGPDSGDPMYDLFAQARSGLPHMTGHPQNMPSLPGAALADHAGATLLALGVMTALVARERHGVGQRVDTSGYGALTWLQSWELTHTGFTGQERERSAGYHPLIMGSYGLYRTRDNRTLAYMDSLTDEGFKRFCDFGGIPELASDARFDTIRKRVGLGGGEAALAASEQRPFLERAFASRTLDEWTGFLEELGSEAMYQEVCTYGDVLEDPQAIESGYVIECDVPAVGKKKMVGNPISLSKTPGRTGEIGGEIGQNNEEIMLELGFDWDFVTKVREETQAAIDKAFADEE